MLKNKVAVVTGASHFDWANLKAEKRFHPVLAYRNSRLAAMWLTYELSPRLQGSGVAANAVCPGFVPETLVEYQPTAFKPFLFRHVLPRLPFARSAEQGSDNTRVTAPCVSSPRAAAAPAQPVHPSWRGRRLRCHRSR